MLGHGSNQAKWRLTLVGLLLATPAVAADIEGSADPEAIGARYPGAEIVRYSQTEFDEFTLLTGPAEGRAPTEKVDLEGRITRASYQIGAERSTLEVLRNYETALVDDGFEILYECAKEECGGRDFNLIVVPYWSGFGENDEEQRYVAARREDGEGTTHVAIYVVRNVSVGGRTKDLIYAQVDVVESAAMETGLEIVSADEMAAELDRAGHIGLYGILFDTDSATLRPDSAPALVEIARLLDADPDLALHVVGHTDSEGSLDYNLDLSQRRAAAVVAFLTAEYGIAAGRLSPHGLGFLAPVATNDTEAGRQLNRRVELVKAPDG